MQKFMKFLLKFDKIFTSAEDGGEVPRAGPALRGAARRRVARRRGLDPRGPERRGEVRGARRRVELRGCARAEGALCVPPGRQRRATSALLSSRSSPLSFAKYHRALFNNRTCTKSWMTFASNMTFLTFVSRPTGKSFSKCNPFLLLRRSNC